MTDLHSLARSRRLEALTALSSRRDNLFAATPRRSARPVMTLR